MRISCYVVTLHLKGITHKAFGSDTIIGMIALCRSMILKEILISAKRNQMLAEGRI